MKILLLIPDDIHGKLSGGVAKYTITLAKHLARHHSVTIVSTGKDNILLREKGVEIVKIQYDRMKFPLQRIWKNLFPGLADRMKWVISVYSYYKNSGPFDLVEAPEWGSSSLFLSLFTKVPVVVRLHKSQFQYYLDNDYSVNLDMHLINLFECVSILLANAITIPTSFILNSHPILKKILVLKKTPIVVIVNGIKLPAIQKKTSENFILSIGRLERGKGVFLLIEAFSIVSRRFPDLRLFFVGADTIEDDGKGKSTKKRMEELLITKGLKEKITILDYMVQEKLYDYISSCLFCVTASIGHENHPFSVLEAIGWGKAIVATNAGGLNEIIENEKSGLVVYENDVASLAQGILRLLKDSKLRKNIEIYNKKYRSTFNIENTISKTVALYKFLQIKNKKY